MMNMVPATNMKNVLIIEDDDSITELLEIHLHDLDCTTTTVGNGSEGFDTALGRSFDLIVLDIMLPGLDGLEVCRRLRTERNHTPILMLTAKSEEIDKVLGLETGADDYLTKPFSVREFIARVKALFRRVDLIRKNVPESSSIFSFHGLVIDREMRRVMMNEKKIELTPREFDLLVLFAFHPGRTYTREELLNTVWGYQYDGYEHNVNSHINRLRSKIELDMSAPRYIRTTWGVGYRFCDPGEWTDEP